jgi:inorganic triphosphatase YgiF
VDRQEIEWQYEAPEGLEEAEEWLLGHLEKAGLVVLEGSSNDLVDTYYDTKDWRLYHTGHALRIRREGGGGSDATMKSLIPAEGNLHRRREVSEPLKSDKVEALLAASGPVGTCLRDLVDARELHRIFEIHTRRQTFDLLDKQVANLKNMQTGGSAEAVRVGEVALDSSEIPRGAGKEPVRLACVEVEVDTSEITALSELERFVKAMESDLKLRPAVTSKYEAGLSATEQTPNGGTNSKQASTGSRAS